MLPVTTIASPCRCQPCRMDSPIGPSVPMLTATTESCRIRWPWNWREVTMPRLSPAPPPMSGTVAPSTPYAPRIISCWSPASESVNITVTRWLVGGSGRSAFATVSPTARAPSCSPVAYAVVTWNAPPKPTTTTPLACSGRGPISPEVEQPITGTSPATSATPARSRARSYSKEAKTMSSLGSGRSSAARVAARPASYGSASSDWPTRTVRVPDGPGVAVGSAPPAPATEVTTARAYRHGSLSDSGPGRRRRTGRTGSRGGGSPGGGRRRGRPRRGRRAGRRRCRAGRGRRGGRAGRGGGGCGRGRGGAGRPVGGRDRAGRCGRARRRAGRAGARRMSRGQQREQADQAQQGHQHRGGEQAGPASPARRYRRGQFVRVRWYRHPPRDRDPYHCVRLPRRLSGGGGEVGGAGVPVGRVLGHRPLDDGTGRRRYVPGQRR